jgi:hypothetical protein
MGNWKAARRIVALIMQDSIPMVIYCGLILMKRILGDLKMVFVFVVISFGACFSGGIL